MDNPRPLFTRWPILDGRVPWQLLAELPTPIEPIPQLGPNYWVKRDGLTSPLYGGNKVRTLEPLCGLALDRGATHIFGIGAYGSNHVLATVVHAPRVGLKTGALLFPQPGSHAAKANVRSLLPRCDHINAMAHWIFLPHAIRRTRRAHKKAWIMPPGGAIPRGTLGYVSAAFEVLDQVRAGVMPWPKHVVLPVGSTCTSAGLLLGFQLAAREFGQPPPHLHAIRVTPWPIAAKFRVIKLSVRASDHLAALAQESSITHTPTDLRPHLTVHGGQLGWGYGRSTKAGLAAIDKLGHAFSLDTVYSAKAMAGLIAAKLDGPTLFWATKSKVQPEAGLIEGPARLIRWLTDC